MAEPRRAKLSVHLTTCLMKCWTCSARSGKDERVGGQTFVLLDPDVGVVVCPTCNRGPVI